MILLIDGTNNFIRLYAGYSTFNSNGVPNGGVYGFLKSLERFLVTAPITQVVIVFDGANGSARRRKINPEYKKGRKPRRLNRPFEIDNPEHNEAVQMDSLKDYLSLLPVSVIVIDNIEADDVIAYTCLLNKTTPKLIVSSDKDFHQLLDDKTIILKPTKNELYNRSRLVEDDKVYPVNYAVARAFIGDKSDNLQGVGGIGFAKLTKMVPMMTEPTPVSVNDVFDFCEKQNDKKYKPFLEHKDRVLKNYEIMQLAEPIISLSSTSQIRTLLENPPSMKKMKFIEKIIRDGMDIGETFFENFKRLKRMNEQCQTIQ